MMSKKLLLHLTAVSCTIRVGKAEDLPLPDGSVDLLTVATAVHWFDQPKFLAEAGRVLKPGGCIALVDFKNTTTRLHYHNCGDKITDIFKEVGHIQPVVIGNRARSIALDHE